MAVAKVKNQKNVFRARPEVKCYVDAKQVCAILHVGYIYKCVHVGKMILLVVLCEHV